MNRFVAIPSALLAGVMLIACTAKTPQPAAESTAPTAPAVAATADVADGCSAKVQSFGPSQIVRGQSFYAQADGVSAYWVIMAPESKGFTITFDGQPVTYSMGADNTISFLHQEPLISAVEKRESLEFNVLCAETVVDKFTIPVVAEAPPAG